MSRVSWFISRWRISTREVARLKAAGLTFESDPVNQPWLWREAYLRDPAGNSLCLYSAGDNRRFPPWRLT